MKKFILILLILLNSKLYSQEPFWDSVATPNVGEVTDMEIDNLSNIYIGSRNGLFISTNHGESWRKIIESNYIPINLIAVNNDNRIAVVKNAIGSPTILYSSDFGSTWIKWEWSYDYYLNPEIYDIEWDNNNNLYILEERGDSVYIHYSRNLDTNWYNIEIPVKISNIQDMSILNDNCYAVVCEKWKTDIYTLFLTKDKGKTWEEIDFPNTRVYCINYFSNNEIFIGTTNGLRILRNREILELISPDTIKVKSMFIPNKKEIFLGTHDFVYFSLDSGKTWQHSKNGMEHLGTPNISTTKSIFKICRDLYQNLFVQTYKWGIYRSTDEGVSWQSSNNGFFSAPIYGITFDKNNNIYLATYGIFKSSDNGLSWHSVGIDGDIFSTIFINSKNYIYASGYYSDALLRSKDGGKTWEKITEGLGLPMGGVTPFYHMVENNRGYLFATTEGPYILRSFDDGDSWDGVLPDSGYGGSGDYITVNYEGHVFATGEEAQLFRSTNNGDNWEIQYNDYNNPASNQQLLFYPNNQIGYVSLKSIFLYTTDNGRTWVDYYKEHNEIPERYPVFIIDSLYNMYWQVRYGYQNSYIVRTNQYGDIIDTVSLCPYYLIDETWAVSPDGYVWRAVSFEGIYRSRKNYVSVKESKELSKVTLNQNIPNPFEEITRIPYILTQPGFVRLTIHNVLGNKIAELVNQYQPEGEYTAVFSTSSYPAGVYFYRLEAGGNVVTKKMQIIR